MDNNPENMSEGWLGQLIGIILVLIALYAFFGTSSDSGTPTCPDECGVFTL